MSNSETVPPVETNFAALMSDDSGAFSSSSAEAQPMNVRIVAAMLSAEQELDAIERALKRRQDWRSARKISGVRALLARVLAGEQEGLNTRYADYQRKLALPD